MKQVLFSFSALVVMGLAGFAVQGIEKQVAVERHGQETVDSESEASVTLLGQFRTSISAWLWLKTDLYLHNGVELRKLTESERKAMRPGVGVKAGEQLLGEENDLVTTVPPPEFDFRGLMGDLERATASYGDMGAHGHNEPEAALPLFRLMTWLDPKFIPGWTVGASVISRDGSELGTRKAFAFLDEGLAANPKSIAIKVEKAELLISRQKALSEAVMLLESAVSFGPNEAQRIREEDPEMLRDAFRWLTLTYRDLGRIGEMRDSANRGLRIFADDAILSRWSRATSGSLRDGKSPITPERSGESHHH